MTDPLAALKELDAARTPGEWEVNDSAYWSIEAGSQMLALCSDEGWSERTDAQEETDARFIAACSTAVPLLIEVAEAAQQVRESSWFRLRSDYVRLEEAKALSDALAALNAADTPGKGES